MVPDFSDPALPALTELLRARGVRLWMEAGELRYAAPAGALDDALRAQVRAAKPALVALLQANQPAPAAIVRAARAPEMPVSLAQQRFWLLHQLAGQGATYNVPQALSLHGDLDVDALDAALGDVVARHESLRTSFQNRGGVPVQVIHAAVDCRIDRVLAEVLDETAARVRARRLVAEAAAHKFELQRAPLLRATLIQVGPQEQVLALVLHHIICDGRSLEILWADLAEAYAARCGGQAPAWLALPVQYADYAAHEATRLASADSARALAWWTATLDGAPPLLELPTDRPRPGVPSFAGDLERFRLGAEASAALRTLAASQQATPFMVLLSILAVVLLRYSGQDEVCIGAPVANRQHPQADGLIGAFVNTVVLRVDGRGNPSFAELLARSRRAALDAFEQQHVPFEQVVQALSPERSGAASPLFQVAVSWLQAQGGLPRLQGLGATLFEFDHPSVKFDLNLEVYEEADDFLVAWFYSTALFDRAAMQRMIGHLRRVLAHAGADPAQAIEGIDLLDAQEQRLLTQDWARAAPVTVPAPTVLHAFAAQVRAAPDKVAVADGAAQLSYGELAGRAQAMAQRLASAGIGPGAVVGVLLAPGADLMVALLGTMAAGAAYLPLDARWPQARIRLMLDDAHASAVIAAADDPGAPALAHGRPLLAPPDGAAAQGTPVSLAAADPAQPAYVIYTSGSTGQPKGVVVGHDNLANYIAWAHEAYGGGACLDMPLFTALAFDLTVTSLFLPLVSGGRVVVYRDRDAVPALFQVFREQQVDLVKLTPAHLAMLGAPDLSLGRIRGLILGGEDLKAAPCRRLDAASAGRVAIYNEYGPTETTVGCMLHRFDPAADSGSSVPIGRPAVGAAIYVLDRSGRPAPLGVPGELHIGGAGVARGYLGRAELTAERFVADPWLPGARMYRSGDLARWRADGTLEYLGRRDHQVKIRGHRVELDEIAAAMGDDPDVADATAIVMARPAASAGPVRHCTRCGLASNYPGVSFDAAGVCDTCIAYAANRERVAGYFHTPVDLQAVFDRARARRRGDYDCLALVSGGKDSVYMLARLKAMGLRILAYTLDPGYLSLEAKANVAHVTALLGIDHRFGTTEHMNEIFVDSLRRNANVCNGCFKTLYTLSLKLAHDEGIPVVATGLSRGQFFETRLSKYYNAPSFDAAEVDREVLDARKLYHRLDDLVDRRLDTAFLRDDRVFQDIEVVDFYRYVDVNLDELLAHLAGLGWKRPSDTGRSTNCLINEAGIFFHKKQRGYHNYALPYAWDVRVGHKTREQAMHELDDEIDEKNVSRMLSEIGWTGPIEREQRAEPLLVGYYVPRAELSPQDLRARLALRLPPALVPDVLVPMDALPLNRNGKVDRAALPPPRLEGLAGGQEPPRNDMERDILAVWQDALGFGGFGIRDNFFALGGHSLMATRVAATITQRCGVPLPLSTLFEKPTVAELAEALAQQERADDDALDLLLADVAGLSDEQARAQLQ